AHLLALVGPPLESSRRGWYRIAGGPGMTASAALVTGASYGVGAATALALARAGFDVAVSATRLDHLAGTMGRLKSLNVRAVPVVLDLRAPESIEAAFAKVTAEFGALDVLVNNAGAMVQKAAVDVTQAEWDEVFNTNVTGPFFLSQRFGRDLIERGRSGALVNIASTHGLVGAAGRSTYGISKAAVIHMTKMLAIEWAEHGIRVNAVAPGRLDTPSPSRADTLSDPGYMQAMLKRIPLHRLATAEEVAAAVCYLAGPGAASITGHTLVLDGGLTSA
ncbi:MAG: SDR family NAD(P)-dependent oxidoreductase, partial [Xanthobacteraceae bacterium]